LLKTDGVINNVLMALGIIDEPLTMMYTSFAVYIGIVYSYLPFMILPLYSNLEKHDLTLLEAASDLGAGPIRAFARITLPLSFPGIVPDGSGRSGTKPGGIGRRPIFRGPRRNDPEPPRLRRLLRPEAFRRHRRDVAAHPLSLRRSDGRSRP